jgi:hypothetical protein
MKPSPKKPKIVIAQGAPNEKPGARISGSTDVDPGGYGSELGISEEPVH